MSEEKVPRLQPERVARWRDRLYAAVVEFAGENLTDDVDGQHRLTGAMARALEFRPVEIQTFDNELDHVPTRRDGPIVIKPPPKRALLCRLTNIHSSLQPLMLGELDKEQLYRFCWRLAALRDRLKTGPVSMDIRLGEASWNAVQVIGAEYARQPGVSNRLGISLKLQVVAGPATPLVFDRWFPERFMYVMTRELGFSYRKEEYQYGGRPDELYGMRFAVLLTASRFNNTPASYDRYDSGGFSVRNKALLKLRATSCPIGVKWACSQCHHGEDTCPVKGRSCRAKTLVKRLCPKCSDNKELRWFNGTYCYHCKAHHALVK